MIGPKSGTEQMMNNTSDRRERSNRTRNHNDWLAEQDRVDDEQY